MEWLAQNLTRAYPFVDTTSDPVTSLFADATVSAGQVGPYTLTIFQPNTLTNAHIQIMVGAAVVLETILATVTTIGTYLVLSGVDSGRGSSYEFILDPLAIPSYTTLTGPIQFDPSACTFTGAVVGSLNSLVGDVTVHLPNYCTAVVDGQVVTIEFQNPVDRVNCSSPDCDKVFTINGQIADQNGSFTFKPDTCLRVVPDVSQGPILRLFDLCNPCLNCMDVETLDAWFVSSANYNYQLAAIYGDQFNRYQKTAGLANQEVTQVQAAAAVSHPSQGVYNVAVRSFNRPYFSQLTIAIVNALPYDSTTTLTIATTGVGSQFTYVANSAMVQQYKTSGQQFTGVPNPFTTPIVVHLGPFQPATITLEVQRTAPSDIGPTVGNWSVGAAYVFSNGIAPVPSSGSVSKTALIQAIPG